MRDSLHVTIICAMMFKYRVVLCFLLTLLVASASGRGSDCHDKHARRSTAKVVKEMPFLGLFEDLRKQSVFEGSDIVRVRGKYYVVFDRQVGPRVRRWMSSWPQHEAARGSPSFARCIGTIG